MQINKTKNNPKRQKLGEQINGEFNIIGIADENKYKMSL
jgi:hypothetical protein